MVHDGWLLVAIHGHWVHLGPVGVSGGEAELHVGPRTDGGSFVDAVGVLLHVFGKIRFLGTLTLMVIND